MKRSLKDILYRSRILASEGDMGRMVSQVHFDSRKVGPGDLFVAIQGTQVDGHRFISQAVEQGAIGVVCEQLPEERPEGATYVKVQNAREALGYIASNYYGDPSGKLRLIGVTGTNGKTTTVTLLYRLFKKLGYEVGMLSTVVNRIGDEEVDASHTTPDPLAINALLHQMVEQGCSYCFMEVSSHALAQDRVTGLSFSGAVFTNITHEHLDYHKTFENYIEAKKKLFDTLPSDAFALVNVDNKHGKTMVRNTKARSWTYGVRTMADIKARVLENSFSGLRLNIDGNDLYTPLIGSFNAYNVLAAYGTAVLLGEEKMEVLTAISALDVVEGRFEYFKTPKGITAIVDYAHSPDALENVLSTIQEVRTGNEQVITVIGCGGDRDTEKRPHMARIATEYSDRVVLTSDNPRSEDPLGIIQEMKIGVGPTEARKVLSIPDRREGIRTACTLAGDNDIVLVAGKGHEKYQEVNGERRSFDDMAVLKETFQALEQEDRS